MNSRFFALMFWSIAVFSCGGNGNKKDGISDIDSTRKSNFKEVPEWVGVYQDTLPCSDCIGTLTWLELKADFTYQKSITLLGKEPVIDHTFSTKGKLSEDKKNRVLWLDSLVESKKTGFFVKGDSTLILCDASGKPETFRFNQLVRRSKKLF
jgi:hypothetical protein